MTKFSIAMEAFRNLKQVSKIADNTINKILSFLKMGGNPEKIKVRIRNNFMAKL